MDYHFNQAQLVATCTKKGAWLDPLPFDPLSNPSAQHIFPRFTTPIAKTDHLLFVIFILGWTVIEAIDSLIRKAGYNGTITESVRKSIQLTRYQSTLFTMHYGDYVSYVKTTRGAAPSVSGLKSC